MPKYIAIEGNIGAGKTTLAGLLAAALDARLVTEAFADNHFLPKFYADPERYAFPLELSFLADRYKQLKDFTAPDLFGQPVVTDYLFIKSKLFARINLAGAEYELFSRIWDAMELHLPQPDVLLYLHAPVSTLHAHIRKRGRDYEQNIKDDYLARITAMYDDYLPTQQVPVVTIDTSKWNFEADTHALKALLGVLSGPLQPGSIFL